MKRHEQSSTAEHNTSKARMRAKKWVGLLACYSSLTFAVAAEHHEKSDFSARDFMQRAEESRVVSYQPQEIGLINGGISCDVLRNDEAQEYVPDKRVDDFGQPHFVSSENPLFWRFADDEYPGLFNVSLSTPEGGNAYLDSLYVDIEDNQMDITINTGNSVAVDYSHAFEHEEVIGGSAGMMDYSVQYTNGEFLVALACNTRGTVDRINRPMYGPNPYFFAHNNLIPRD